MEEYGQFNKQWKSLNCIIDWTFDKVDIFLQLITWLFLHSFSGDLKHFFVDISFFKKNLQFYMSYGFTAA